MIAKKFDNLSFKSKCSFLYQFFKHLNEFNKLKTHTHTQKKQKQKTRKRNVHDAASELYNEFLETYFDEYYNLSVVKRKKMNHEYEPEKLFLKAYNYNSWYESEESTVKEESTDKEKSVDLSDVPSLEDDEEVKQGKVLKILTPNKLLTRLPILLVQIKAGNDSDKLKNEIKQILYLLYEHNKITKKLYNNLIKSL